MSNKERLVFAIIDFLSEELSSGELTADVQESLEVAIQCLETAYSIDTRNAGIRSRLHYSKPLQQVFDEAVESSTKSGETQQTGQFPEVETEKAEELKNEGNELMKLDQFSAAIEKYTMAIQCDPNSAVYYCNRAAAYSKLGQFDDALSDCDIALQINPSYSKAYGRKGLAYTSKGEYQQAAECYTKAVELEPANPSYMNNLKVCEQKLKELSGGGGGGAGQGAGGVPDIGQMLNNPVMMNMAQQILQNPQMQQMFSSVISSTIGSGGAGNAPGPGAAPAADGNIDSMSNLLQAGQHFAQQMQEQNPQLVEQLRQQMTGSEGGNNDSSQPDTKSDAP